MARYPYRHPEAWLLHLSEVDAEMRGQSLDDHIEPVTDPLSCLGIKFALIVGSLPVHQPAAAVS